MLTVSYTMALTLRLRKHVRVLGLSVRVTEAALLQRLGGFGTGPELQHRLSGHHARPAEGGALAAGALQHLPAAVHPVPAEHRLHPGAGSATVSDPQVSPIYYCHYLFNHLSNYKVCVCVFDFLNNCSSDRLHTCRVYC